ncbi:MBL fold metallo-hydrolase, partial [Vibrio alfacsensis]
FSGFRDIGERYGPFDLTLMETGAYDDRWAGIHMFPEQSVQAHIDVKGSVMLPIHNSTFDLSFHAWNEPLKRLVHEASERNV